jgi:hypothetical protein
MNQIESEQALVAAKKLLENTPVVDVSARQARGSTTPS